MTDICAIATSTAASGAVGIVRVSGPNAHQLLDAICTTPHKGAWRELQLCKLVSSGIVFDTALAVRFQAPASYTGEDMVEIHCHGNKLILHKTLQALCEAGAQLALPGEFTQRAFINGKIDLAQAEAVAEIISSNSLAAIQAGQRSLQGGLSTRIADLRSLLIATQVQVEALLDFADEEQLDLAPHIEQDLQEIIGKCQTLCQQAERSRMLANPQQIAIIGAPNVGKSSLLNSLVGEQAAIVTEHSGTTRDAIDRHVALGDIEVQITDTAGLRETDNVVESIGIARTREIAANASVVILVQDCTANELLTIPQALQRLQLPETIGKKTLAVYNKADLLQNLVTDRPSVINDELLLSAHDGTNIEQLISQIESRIATTLPDDDLCLASMRQVQLLASMQEALTEGLAEARLGNVETCAHSIANGQSYLDQILGTFSNDDLLDAIFRDFCIGK